VSTLTAGRFGPYGGRYVPETLMAALEQLETAYAARSRLVHEWRAFLFTDPQLPDSLLPDPWPGRAAAEFFDRHANRLRPAADRYVDRCL